MNGLLTITEVKGMLQVSRKTVEKYIHIGLDCGDGKKLKLRVIDIGVGKQTRYRIRQEDLDDFLKGAGGRTTGGTA